MTDTSAAAAPATPSVFTEIDTMLNLLNKVLPGIATTMSFFPATAPAAATISLFTPLFSAVVNGVNTVAADAAAGGKTVEQVIQDAITTMGQTFAPPAAPSA